MKLTERKKNHTNFGKLTYSPVKSMYIYQSVINQSNNQYNFTYIKEA